MRRLSVGVDTNHTSSSFGAPPGRLDTFVSLPAILSMVAVFECHCSLLPIGNVTRAFLLVPCCCTHCIFFLLEMGRGVEGEGTG